MSEVSSSKLLALANRIMWSFSPHPLCCGLQKQPNGYTADTCSSSAKQEEEKSPLVHQSLASDTEGTDQYPTI